MGGGNGGILPPPIRGWKPRLREPVECHVHANGRMRKSARTDAFDTRFRDSAHGLQGDPAGRFQLDGRTGAIAQGYCLAKYVGRHIVEQDNVWTGWENFCELREGIDFDFDDHRFRARVTRELLADIISRHPNGLGR